ncbi:DUF4919 domain-containing protein [Pseudobacteroides cellulosolvens]|uniref:Uncharacterized protein n=1 Tax=Pseudobacteroides cellulosolvens ATCC 35603 = DSM 2933 TaxID=398512 RepID=A0A0L6JX48_9FIRM|nr:DUF4919 domain-containing protein [Pseudobacteroides cellulosolvens]KNY30304.1 hypothetical protein Bccel_5584 [Pseudobacteroides cellulosolvens ATCC 35603 = DSM 2933]
MWFFKNKQKASLNYEDILKKNPTEIDYLQLRMAYTKTNYYNPYGSRNELNELSNLFEEGKFKEIINKAPKLLTAKFVDIDFHMVVFSAAEQVNDEKISAFHGFIINKLVDSILNSGDGKTPETAFIVINTDEEYALLGCLGLRRTTQSLIKHNERSYDLLEAVDKEGNQHKIYFNIDIPFNWLGAKMK